MCTEVNISHPSRGGNLTHDPEDTLVWAHPHNTNQWVKQGKRSMGGGQRMVDETTEIVSIELYVYVLYMSFYLLY